MWGNADRHHLYWGKVEEYGSQIIKSSYRETYEGFFFVKIFNGGTLKGLAIQKEL